VNWDIVDAGIQSGIQSLRLEEQAILMTVRTADSLERRRREAVAAEARAKTELAEVIAAIHRQEAAAWELEEARKRLFALRRKVSGAELLARIEREFGFRDGELLYGGSRRQYVVARGMLVYLLRELGWSYPQIGKLLNKHHTTVINAVNSFERLKGKEAGARIMLQKLRGELNERPLCGQELENRKAAGNAS
jgi:chromosomal replication initiation ATPase DnaA